LSYNDTSSPTHIDVLSGWGLLYVVIVIEVYYIDTLMKYFIIRFLVLYF